MDGNPAPLDDPRAFLEWLVARAGSQAELARLAGLLPTTISDYVRGANEPKLTNTLKMLRAVGARLDEAPPQEAVRRQQEADRVQEALATQVERFQHLNDQIEAELAPPPQTRKRSE